MKKIIMILLVYATVNPLFAKARLETYKNAKLQICDIRLLGCSDRIIIKGKSYLIDIVTDRANTTYKKVVADLRQQKKLEISLKETRGYILTEKGHFPNPMVNFDVFHLLDLKAPEKK
jgi:hypothetical protein